MKKMDLKITDGLNRTSNSALEQQDNQTLASEEIHGENIREQDGQDTVSQGMLKESAHKNTGFPMARVPDMSCPGQNEQSLLHDSPGVSAEMLQGNALNTANQMYFYKMP